ncbi:DNA/RNA non-specific endonuclease [Lacticaseibacillus zhaodongensis]|uniref:DNA/RNA non-specific endonuclease n=1 Tax=Lacticaseibacillus zhaodongensis TaxID=2668065 RepID=UPI0012D2FC12|nr:DNA/RNA non-specific endonuclease [Lacticaseibacillus zhaodongensis]
MSKFWKQLLVATAIFSIGATTAACGQSSAPAKIRVVKKYDHKPEESAKKLEVRNVKRQQKLNKDTAAFEKKQAAFADKVKNAPATVTKAAPKPAPQSTNQQLADMNYSGQQEIVVNGNKPGFGSADLSTARGAWEQYSDLDSLNRAVAGNALLNQSLMPTEKRTGQTWDPTGWHNRRIPGGWLYNRSHLIGFQLTGENNNPKNLMTGTRSLNSPLMLAHEDDIAYYIKQSSSHYVRYQVQPVYRGNELVARGVHMRAQSVGDNSVSFNVYIFNVEDGYTINYADGTSSVAK